MPDMINHPPHYTGHESGVECIQIVEHMGFCLGNAIKYIWRADTKGDALGDLEKARWYIDREIQRRRREASQAQAYADMVRDESEDVVAAYEVERQKDDIANARWAPVFEVRHCWPFFK